MDSEAQRLMAEADGRMPDSEEARRRYLAERTAAMLSRSHVRPTERPTERAVIGAGGAYVMIIAAAAVGALAVWLLPPVFNAFFAWLAGWM